MASDRPHYQVVFLIDLFQSKSCGSQSDCSSDGWPSTICLTVFRVLINLLGKILDRSEKDERQMNKACRKLKWGCKFFDSQEHKGKIERSQFKSFKLKHFEVFEKEVEKRLEQSKAANEKERTDSSVENKRRRCSLGYKTKTCCPADNVGKVLSEVFADFQWEGPDLMSPGRPHRRKGKPARWGRAGLNSSRDESTNGTRCVRNLLFILSKCPNNEEKLKSFCGKKCIDGDVFLDSVLTTAMIDKLRGNLRLDLFWIDTGGKTADNDFYVNEDSVAKVRDALFKVGGKLIPLDAILQGHTGLTLSCYDSTFPSVLVPDLSQKSSTTGRNSEKFHNLLKSSHLDYSCIVPTSSLLEHYLHTSEVCDKRKSVEKAQTSGGIATAGCLCVKTGGKEVTVCKLLLQSAVKHQDSSTLTEGKFASNSAWSLTSTVKTQTCEDVTSFITSQDERSVIVNTCWISADELMRAYRFTVVGAVRLQPHLVQVLSGGMSFVCCGQLLDAEKRGQRSLRSQYFQTLLSEMITHQKLLVISLQVLDMRKAQRGPGLALLQPMALQSGILTILSSTQALILEKQLLTRSQEDQGEISSGESFDEWRNKVIQGQLKVPVKSEYRSHIPETSEKPEPRPFNCSILETWYSSGPSGRMASLVQKLSDRVEGFGFLSAEEKALLKQVQKQYRRENQPMLHSQYEERDQKAKLEQDKAEQDKANGEDVDEVDGSVGNIVVLQRLRSNTNIITGGRGELMLKSGIQKSKKKSIPMAEEEEKCSKKERLRPDINAADFQDVNELVSYLQNVYAKTITEADSVDTCVQTIVLVALHFLKQSGADNSEESLKELFDERILICNKSLRQKHSQADCDLTEEQKLLEYKLQIQLQFELAASLSDVDTMSEDCIEEVCNMLRKWSISGKLDIKKYLEDVLVEHYIHTLPKSLGSLYSTLMLPLPDQLAKVVPRGDHSSMDDSCLSDTLISPVSSVGQGSETAHSNPPSLSQQPLSDRSDILMSANFKVQKSRKIAVHPSLSDLGPKRQIMVAVNPASRKRTQSKQIKAPRSARKGSARKGSVRKNSARKGSARKGSARKSSARKKKKLSAVPRWALILFDIDGCTLVTRTSFLEPSSNIHKSSVVHFRHSKGNLKAEILALADADVKAVRRNLFMSEGKLERRQSVAVMENLRSPKVRRKQRSALCSPRRSPRAVKTNTPNLVAETPAHKQKLVLRRKESQRETRLESAPVVMESPLKPSLSTNTSATSEARPCFSTKSPSKSQVSILSSRRSFYSAGPNSQSRNLERYRQLANRIAGRDPQSRDQLRSPDRLFVVKQLKGSPSPSYSLRCTPQKLNITPVKSVVDSPSQNTRSRAAVELVLYRGSPKTSGRTPKEIVTRKLTLSMTPEKSTKQDECLFPSFQEESGLVPGTPVHKISAQEKTDVVDSPSRNTRSQINSAGIRNLCFDSDSCANEKEGGDMQPSTVIQLTPAKETPWEQNSMSPFKKTPQRVSQGTVSAFERTPQKSATPCTPPRITTASNQNTPPTPASILKRRRNSQESLVSPQRLALKVRWREESLECVQGETGDHSTTLICSSPADIHHRKSPYVLKTPTQSPRKPRVRTPDFDSWPRRKSRFSQVISPKLTATVNTSATVPPVGRFSSGGDKSEGISTITSVEEVVSVGKTCRVWRWKPGDSESQDKKLQTSKAGIEQIKCSHDSQATDLAPEVFPGTISVEKKTYSAGSSDENQVGAACVDISPDENSGRNAFRKTGVPSGKRQRSKEDKDEEVISVKRQCRVASPTCPVPLFNCNPIAFKPDPSSGTDSGVTGASGRTDYFASTNEEVFLSSDVLSDPVVSPSSSDISSASSLATSPKQASPKFTRLHSLKKFSHVLSSGSESGMELAETNSPIFMPTVKHVINRENCKTSSEANCRDNTSSASPGDKCSGSKARVSPACGMSYSPNVSAKGLLSLMNSPLIRSGPGKRSRLVAEDGSENTEVVRFTDSKQQSNKRRKTVARSRRSLNLLK